MSVESFEFWQDPPVSLTLRPQEVHVWRADLDQPDWVRARLALTLAADEQQRAQRFYFEQDRQRFTCARGILRMLLGRYLQKAPEQLCFVYGSHGKPRLTESPLCFNLSHSQELALYAVSWGREVGVDLEFQRPVTQVEQLVERFFSRQESTVFRALPLEQRQEAFFLGWTRKEAYIKARGRGLSLPLAQFDVTLAPGESARLLHCRDDALAACRWSLHSLDPGPAYAAALAVEGQDWQLSCWQWYPYDPDFQP
ncbi:4'-phosphopantetheinyl transferase family protein [Anthocerotibacter panamensis]|uniref:4'-phosphopantetheinyl transferase family protein n=1 Tax=Anthocerotibacter panamensis TaxID=2857077 RepID=UPI001C402E4D|nr:4'-phosphopantetheinyl transferase superfamily protein [Anthocerotibacter panamensis]